MKYDKQDLRECPHDDITCLYWDWHTYKCTMYAEDGVEPKDECDEYFGLEESEVGR